MRLIGFVGNACVGKTTAAFGLVQYLKLEKQRVGYVNDLCRSMPFSRELFDTKPEARLAVLFDQMKEEAIHSLRTDVDYLITERTALDWFLYYQWTCDNVGRSVSQSIWEMVREHVQGYDTLFYMDDQQIEYVRDGFRPASVDLREQMSKMYADRWSILQYNEDDRAAEVVIDDDDVAIRCEKAKFAFKKRYLEGT
jgi:hypothetical protein